MDKALSLKISGYISQKITELAPVVDCSTEELSRAKDEYEKKRPDVLGGRAMSDPEFEVYYSVKKGAATNSSSSQTESSAE